MALTNARSNPTTPWAWAASGLLVGALAASIASAPAVWVERAVNGLSQNRVLLSDSLGTVWNGSAQLALTGGAGSRDAARLPGRVHWSARLGWGQVGLSLRASCCTPQPVALTVSPALQGWSLRMQASQSSWPASLLAGLGTPWNTLQTEGNLVVNTPGLGVDATLDRWTLQGEVTVEAQDVRSRLSTLQPLGSYQLRLTGGAQPALALSTLKGDLQLRGEGRWTAGNLRFEGEASAEPAHAQELSNLLNIMGRRDGVRSVITLG